MSGTRNTVKNAIQSIVSQATGVKSVFTYRPKLMQQTNFPAVIVNIAKSNETRLTTNAPHGRKMIKFTAQLEISTVDLSADGSGQNDFDDILDNIDAQLRLDPMLGGVAVGATVEYINTLCSPPQIVNGSNVVLMAIKQFDVTVQISNA